MLILLFACFARGPMAVDPRDLAALPPGSAPEVSAAEWGVETAEATLAAARREQARVAMELAQAQAANLADEADVEAIEAEVRAARAREDDERLQAAREVLRDADRRLRVSQALVAWKQRAVDAAEANTRRAEVLVTLKDAELELARVQALGRRGHEGYDLDDFTEQLAERREEWEQVNRRARDAAAAAEQARQDWLAVSAPGV